MAPRHGGIDEEALVGIGFSASKRGAARLWRVRGPIDFEELARLAAGCMAVAVRMNLDLRLADVLGAAG
jgi:hypothetical protein